VARCDRRTIVGVELSQLPSERPPKSVAPVRGEPVARRVIFAGFRAAATAVWGPEGLPAIRAQMPSEVRERTLDPIVLSSEMLPERYVMAWYEAVWTGPANRQQAPFCTFLDRMMDHGFGRVRKVLLGLVSPAQLAVKASELWRHDHDTGTMTTSTAGCVTTIMLRDHVYTTTPLSRLAISEILRYAISLARGTREPTETHALDPDGSLRTRVTWG
jgi:hypothetical protein